MFQAIFEDLLFILLFLLDLFRYILLFWLICTLFQAFMGWRPHGWLKKALAWATRIVAPALRFMDLFVPPVRGIDITPAALLVVVFVLQWILSALLGYTL